MNKNNLELFKIEENQTFASFVKGKLASMGMFDYQIQQVFPLIVQHKSMEQMSDRWDDKISDYGGVYSPLVGILMAGVKDVCLKYIDETCPEAWFRPLFLSFEEQEKIFKQSFGNK